jgi:pimeloyl-ACP methyl ester carboxylesterase
MHRSSVGPLVTALLLLVAALAPLGVALTDAGASVPTVEATYGAEGPWAVTMSQQADATGQLVDLYYPADLGASGFRHPVITWGNGSLTPTTHYARILRHLASWGFVVVATQSTWTGSGDAILAAARFLVEQNDDPSSRFYRRLDVTNVGAAGHSQGAYGALSAALKSGGLIRTVIPIGLPDTFWLSPLHAADLSDLTQAVFFVGGGNDWLATPVGALQYVEQVPGAVAVALLRRGPHDGIVNDAPGYLGYVTAWMMYQLRGDTTAAAAFVGPQAEISENAEWDVPFLVNDAT